MSRLRVMFLTTGLLLVSAALSYTSLAQGPGGGRGNRGGGPGGFGGGPGGRGMGGFGGFGGDSLLALAKRTAVQEELKVSEKQKTQIGELDEDYNQRRQKLFENMRPNGGGPGGRGNNGGRRGGNQNNGGFSAQGGAIGNFGGGPNAFASAYEINPYSLNTTQEPQQGGEEPQQDDRQARFQAMRESMTQLDQQANATLAKILTAKQYQRLNQIQIQVQGINALVRPDVAEKIQLDETQVEAIQGVINDRRTAQREVFAKQGEVFRSFRPKNGGGPNRKDQNAAGAGKAGADTKGADADQAQADNGGNGGGNGNRRRGGGGGQGPGQGGPQFDREAMKKFMEQPEVKAQMDKAQAANAQLDNKATQAAYKILTKYQLASYKKLQGPPFDVSKLRPNFGGPGGNRDGNDAQTSKSATKSTTEKADTEKADTEKETATANSETKKSTAKSKTKASAKTKRSNVRQRQNLEGDAGIPDFSTDFDQN